MFPKLKEDRHVPKGKALEMVELKGVFDQEVELILKTSLLCNSRRDVETCGRAFCRKLLWDRGIRGGILENSTTAVAELRSVILARKWLPAAFHTWVWLQTQGWCN